MNKKIIGLILTSALLAGTISMAPALLHKTNSQSNTTKNITLLAQPQKLNSGVPNWYNHMMGIPSSAGMHPGINFLNGHMYFVQNGQIMVGWIQIGNKSYYGQCNGQLATGGCVINGVDFAFTSQGVCTGLMNPNPNPDRGPA